MINKIVDWLVYRILRYQNREAKESYDYWQKYSDVM